MMPMKEQDFSGFFDDLNVFDDCWEQPTSEAPSMDNICSSFSSSEDSIGSVDSPFMPRTRGEAKARATAKASKPSKAGSKEYSKAEVKKRVHEVSCEEASYFVDTLVIALNAYDSLSLRALLSQVCVPDVLVMNYCYEGLKESFKDENEMAIPMEAYPIIGVDQFAAYWNMVQEYIPDGAFLPTQTARPCTTDGDSSVYIGGVQFQGTSLVKEGATLFTTAMRNTSNHQRLEMTVTKVALSGSMIVYVNAHGLIYRIDLYLEY